MMGSCFSSNESTGILSQTPMAVQDTSQPSNPYLNKMHEITSEEEFKQLINHPDNVNILIVCDFHANWCAPCVQIAPSLHQWAVNDYKTSVIFLKIDVDEQENLANQFSINVIPTLIFFKQGKGVKRFGGADLAYLRREIEKFK